MSAAQPVRYPDKRSRPLMTKRGRWLVALNILVPGSAQVLAGDRRLGRFGLATTLVLWGLVVLGVVLALAARGVLIAIVTSPLGLGALVVVTLFYAGVWTVLTLDTLRLVRLVNVAPNARPLIAGASILVLVATLGGAGFVVSRSVSAMGLLDAVFSDGQIAEPIDGRYNILLLGGDAGPDRLGLRPDSISVVSVDAVTGSTVVLGVPRNLERAPFVEGSPLWGPFPDGYSCGVDCLISYLYTYAEENPDLYPDAVEQGSRPGIEAMRDAVEGVLGLTLQYYVIIDMQGFVQLIDALGGIDIDVAQRVPIEGGQDSAGRPTDVAGWIEPGFQHLDGYHALWYARARHGTNDYDRMNRQRDVQEAVLRQADPANVLLRFNEIAASGAQIVGTDIPSPMLAHFVELAAAAKEQPLVRHDFVPPEVDVEDPDFDAIRAQVDVLTAPVTPSPQP